MLFIVTSKGVGVELAQLQGHNGETFGFKSGQNGSDQSAFNGIGLQKDKGTVRHGR
jgi:hypothetical protein